MTERPGIAHLNDLEHRDVWNPRAIVPFVAETALVVDPDPAWRAFTPPRVLVLIVKQDDASLLARSRVWLRGCQHVVVLRDCRGEWTADDEELRPLGEEEWQRTLARLPDHAVFDWFDGNDACRDAIDHAVALAAALPPAPTRPPPERPDLELPMSRWIERTGKEPESEFAIGSRLVWRDGQPVLVDTRATVVSLAAPRGPIHIAHTNESVVPPLTDKSMLEEDMWDLGVDPIHPIAWRGSRMAVYWLFVGAYQRGFLSATDHDDPCGPAEELWGSAENDPVEIAMSPAADACLQRFRHDATILEALPIAWHRAGAVDVAAFARDPRRATLYAQTADFVRDRATPDLLDEDNRELAPVVVLGPSPAVRYAVDLRHLVVRIRNQDDAATAEIIGGPDAGFAVFDRDHRPVRRGTGLLLGGWFQHATIEDAGFLWREDLATGERVLLGSAARLVCLDPDAEAVVQDAIREGRHDAVAVLRAEHPTRAITGEIAVLGIPGTRNILEIAAGMLRVV